MTWTLEGSQGREAQKVKWDLVPYTRGTGVDLGCGGAKAFDHFIGVDNLTDTKLFGTPMQPNVVVKTCEDLGIFADNSLDYVFSSHLLEHIADWRRALAEWWRIVKPGGHLCLYLPHRDLYPQIGTEEEKAEWMEWAKAHATGTKVPAAALRELAERRKAAGHLTVGEQYAGTPAGNHDHKHDFAPDDIVSAMRALGGWDLVENETRDGGSEYSFFQVYRKLDGTEQRFTCNNPKPEKTCAVVRYGAFGDLIQASVIFPGLKKQGYHVTLYTVPRGFEAIKHDPHIDRVIFQDTDQVPPPLLGEFWAHLTAKYDKFVNLSESVEGTLLALGNRIQGTWPTRLRHKLLNRNYLETACDIADVPFEPQHAKFYATPEERAWAKAEREKMGSYVIMWSLAGSSVHKTWPHLDTILARVMLEWKDANVVLVGDKLAKMLEAGWENEPRVLCRSDVWTIREAMSMIDEVDLLIGPETGVLNAGGMSRTPKICILSHSSSENLTRDWVNCSSMTPVDTPCYPCHMMHYGFQHCKEGFMEIQGERQRVGALCAVNIHPDRVWDAMCQWRKRKIRKAA